MKIIDQTPLIDDKGNLGFAQRIQGMLRFGFNWANELQAQKAIVTFFDRNLEKGYTLVRNITLGQSEIMIPIILLGPAGIYVIHITYLRGRYEAKGDSWNVEAGNQYKPAPINLIQRTARMARALQVFIERQGVKLPAPIEPVLIAADPGLHIESLRPAIKVMMVDGIKSFVSTLAAARPVLNAPAVNDFVERIINPRPPKPDSVPKPAPAQDTPVAWEQDAQPNVSRARAIFDASEEAKPFNPADFDFAMTDGGPDAQANPAVSQRGKAGSSSTGAKPNGGRILGMTPIQLVILAALGSCLICILIAGFGFIIPNLP